MKRLAVGHLLLGFGALALLLPGSDAFAQKQSTSTAKQTVAGQRQQQAQWIVYKSTSSTNSNILGLSGLPVTVRFPNGNPQDGTYITRVNPLGPGSHMGIAEKTVLMSVDNVPTTSPAELDRVLTAHPSGNMRINYVRMMGGVPTMMQLNTALLNNNLPLKTDPHQTSSTAGPSGAPTTSQPSGTRTYTSPAAGSTTPSARVQNYGSLKSKPAQADGTSTAGH